MSVLAALGDSVSSGEGVGITIRPDQTWPALLAKATGRLLHNQAAAGAKVRDVRRRQLPDTPNCEVATVLVGLNDVCRGGFDADNWGEELDAIISGLHWRADQILLARLPDPARFLWVPKRVRAVARARLDAANHAIDKVGAASPRVTVLDLGTVHGLQVRCGWAVDRVHPSVYGHLAIAAAAAELLGAGPTAPLRTTALPGGSGTARHAWWLVRHGAPYLLRNGHTFARPIAEGIRRAG